MSGARLTSARVAGSCGFLGLIYLIAFVSFWVQADGLSETRAFRQCRSFLTAARARARSTFLSRAPDALLAEFERTRSSIFSAAPAHVLSLLLIVGIAPILCLALLFVLYLSLTVAGQTFFSFQWDVLLLETGFLAIFLAPWTWWPQSRAHLRRFRARRFSFFIFCFSN